MLKSPEEYLATLEFDSVASGDAGGPLNAGERAFVEKYLGLDALRELPEESPEPIPLLQAREASPPAPLLLPPPPQIIVAPAEPDLLSPPLEVVVAPAPTVVSTDSLPEISPLESMPVATEVVAPPLTAEASRVDEVDTEVAEVAAPAVDAVAASVLVETEPDVAQEIVAVDAQESVPTVVRTDVVEEVVTAVATETEAAVAVEDAVATETMEQIDAPVATVAPEAAAIQAPEIVKPDVLLKEKLRQEAEVQLVSFYVAGQIFLLPVEGIQEVLRHMELIKVPQAPDFVAGVINLRGRVTPVVHLSALLTNAGVQPYDERNFIIITGDENLQLGLIIDKVSSMHLIPQNKFIWNPESKLAEAAEFLNAIVDLDDRVCGMVAPEAITRLILPEI